MSVLAATVRPSESPPSTRQPAALVPPPARLTDSWNSTRIVLGDTASTPYGTSMGIPGLTRPAFIASGLERSIPMK